MLLESILLGGAVSSTVARMIKADKLNEKAESVNVRSFERVVEAEEKVKIQSSKTQASIQKLINRKRGIYKTSIVNFLELYRNLQKIEMEEGAGLKELRSSFLSPIAVESMNKMVGVSKSELSDSQVFSTYIFSGIAGVIKKKQR